MIGKILFGILLFLVWIVCMLAVILIGLFIVQVGFREIFEVDIFIRLKELAQKLFAPKLDKAFYGKDGAFYISVPREVVNNAKKMILDTNSLEENNNG